MEHTALNCRPGRWLIDTNTGNTPGRVVEPIAATPLLMELQRERDSLNYQAEINAFVAEYRARSTTRRASAACGTPYPIEPVEEILLPATWSETATVIGVALAGSAALVMGCRALFNVLGG